MINQRINPGVARCGQTSRPERNSGEKPINNAGAEIYLIPGLQWSLLAGRSNLPRSPSAHRHCAIVRIPSSQASTRNKSRGYILHPLNHKMHQLLFQSGGNFSEPSVVLMATRFSLRKRFPACRDPSHCCGPGTPRSRVYSQLWTDCQQLTDSTINAQTIESKPRN